MQLAIRRYVFLAAGALLVCSCLLASDAAELLAYRLAAHSDFVLTVGRQLTLSGLLAVESARLVPLVVNRNALARVNALAPRLISELTIPGVTWASITADGKRLLIESTQTSAGNYIVWDLESNVELLRLPFTPKPNSNLEPAISPDGRWLVVPVHGSPAGVWDIDARRRVTSLTYTHPQDNSTPPPRFVFSEGGRWLAELSGQQELSVWTLGLWTKRPMRPAARPTSVVFGDHDQWMVVCLEGDDAYLWRLPDGDGPIVVGKTGTVVTAAASAGSPLIVTAGDGTRVFRVQTAVDEIDSLPGEYHDAFLSPDGRIGAAHHYDEDAADQNFLQTFRIGAHGIQPLSRFFTASTVVSSDASGSTLLDALGAVSYDATTGRVRHRFEPDTEPRASASADLSRVAVWAGERLWIFDGQSARSLPNPETDHGKWVFETRMPFTLWTDKRPDERFRAQADDDTLTLRVFEGKDRPYLMLEDFPGGGFNFSDDGRRILRSDWRLEPYLTEDLIAETCARMPRNLTRDEWQQYMGKRPYRATCPKLPPAK